MKFSYPTRRLVALTKRMYLKRRRGNLSHIRKRFYQKFWHDAANSIGAEIRSLENEYFEVRRGDRATIVQYHFVNADTYLNQALADDKLYVKGLLDELDLKTPASMRFRLQELDCAMEFCKEQESAVVKPVVGSGGVGVTTGIRNPKALTRAAITASARLGDPELIVEAQLSGESYRLLYLAGDLIDVIERRRPTVKPDGKKSIKQLIAHENELRRNSDPARSLLQVSTDLDCLLCLEAQGLKLSSVPEVNWVPAGDQKRMQ